MVDYGVEALNGRVLREFIDRADYSLADVPHRFLTVGASRAASLAEGEKIIRAWLPTVGILTRQPVPVSALRVALQCGGSDAFSGISANPVVGLAGREIVRYCGAVSLTETDELVGAEGYILANVRNPATARRFLEMGRVFKERLGWHGATVEANRPREGTPLGGIYNITLKSLGAARKKDPGVRLDHVIDYADPLRHSGFYFNERPRQRPREGIAGQVASGCNMVIFTTGSGSITNFPFVPTIKVTSTSRRHRLLADEMDFNAGAYLEGAPMEPLGKELFSLVLEVAGGRRTMGELAGHSQVSIWRDWRQTNLSRLADLRGRATPNGRALPIMLPPAPVPDSTFPAFRVSDRAWACDRVGLIVPTSMCSSQIARLAAERLNASSMAHDHRVSRFVALPHTEGCGFAGDEMHALLRRTIPDMSPTRRSQPHCSLSTAARWL